jgi:hypothetical protein
LLWLFGLFASSGSGGFNLDMFDNDDGRFEELTELGHAIEGMMGVSGRDFPLELLAPLLLAGGMMVLVFIALHIISVPALIDAVNRIKRGGGTFRVGQSFSVGIDFMLRMLGLVVLSVVTFMVTIGGGILIVVVAAAIHWSLAVLAVLVLIPCFFILIWTITNVVNLAQRSMVVRNSRISDALEEGWRLFRQRPKENLVIFLIQLGLSIGIAIATTILWAILGIPIALVAMGMGMGLILTVLLVVMLGMPASLVIGGFAGTALFNIYTLFYFELVEPTQSPTPMPPYPTTMT